MSGNGRKCRMGGRVLRLPMVCAVAAALSMPSWDAVAATPLAAGAAVAPHSAVLAVAAKRLTVVAPPRKGLADGNRKPEKKPTFARTDFEKSQQKTVVGGSNHKNKDQSHMVMAWMAR